MLEMKPGDKFGRLTYVRSAGTVPHGKVGGRLRVGEYHCDCGQVLVLPDYRVRNGYTKSCGCLQREKARKRCLRHGLSDRKLYGVWGGIITRCENTRHRDYQHYGAKGVRMCEEWRRDFRKFYDWAMANGWKPGLTIDRIALGPSGYSPENCRIVDRRGQSDNREVTLYVEYDGTYIPVSRFAERIGEPYQAIYHRYRDRLMVKQHDGTYKYRFASDKKGKPYERK